MSSFIKENSNLPALRACSVLFHTPCRRPICPWCAYARSAERRAEWMDAIDPNDCTLFVRLSVASSANLNRAWADFAATVAQFNKRSWLTSQCAAWTRSVELTEHRGMWHWHVNFLILGSPDQLDSVQDSIAQRWATAAADVGVEATGAAQYAERSDSTPAVREYIFKGLMGYASNPDAGRTPGDILRDAYNGDADAMELWHTIEGFFVDHPHVILTQMGKGFQRRRSDFDLVA